MIETYAPRPFRGRGEQGATGIGRCRSVRERKVVLAQQGHAAQQPFSELLPPQESRISQLRSFYPDQALERDHPSIPGSNDVPAQMNADRGTSITAEIGECVANTLSTRKISTPVATRSAHVNARGGHDLQKKDGLRAWSRGRCVGDAGNGIEYPGYRRVRAVESSRN